MLLNCTPVKFTFRVRQGHRDTWIFPVGSHENEPTGAAVGYLASVISSAGAFLYVKWGLLKNYFPGRLFELVQLCLYLQI